MRDTEPDDLEILDRVFRLGDATLVLSRRFTMTSTEERLDSA